jgi:peptidoglycan-associated lipoprotein
MQGKPIQPPVSSADAAVSASPLAEALRVYFDGESVDIRDSDRDRIREHARQFLGGPGGSLVVSGHANPEADPERSVALSMDRTDAVASLLQQFGVQSHRIVRVSHGANALPADAADEKTNWANRCVEIRLGGLTPRKPVWSQRLKKGAPPR